MVYPGQLRCVAVSTQERTSDFRIFFGASGSIDRISAAMSHRLFDALRGQATDTGGRSLPDILSRNFPVLQSSDVSSGAARARH
jgi:hypothetical protein